MTPARALLLSLMAFALPVLAQAQDRPTIRHYERPGCDDCAAITTAVRALETRWSGRVAAVVAKRPKAAQHGHDLELFLRPTRDPAEAVISLRWTDPFGRPTAATSGQVHARVGDAGYGIGGALRGPDLARHGAWTLLAARIKALRASYSGASPWGRPVVLDVDRRVPRGHLLRALEMLARTVDADVKAWPQRAGAPPESVPVRKRVEPPEPSTAPEAPAATEPPRASPRPKPSAAVKQALAWLVRHQAPSGAWLPAGWRARCRTTRCAPSNRDLGDARYQIGLSALVLLALEGAGHTRTRGKHRLAVVKGVRWLVSQQRREGSIGFGQGEEIYNHAFAATALCRLAGKNAALRKAAQLAIDWTVKAQNPNLGWKYGFRSGRNDTSVTAWMVQALAAGRELKLQVPRAARAGARRWIQRVTTNAGEAGYQSPGGGSAYLMTNDGKYDALPVMTAAAIRARHLLGDPPALLKRSQRLLTVSTPAWVPNGPTRTCNFYYWFWGSEASYGQGPAAWATWKKALERALLPNQETRGCATGSWKPVGEWCLAGGRVYATAINVLSLTTERRLKAR